MTVSRMLLASVAGVALVAGSLVVAAPASADSATYVNTHTMGDPSYSEVSSFDVNFAPTTFTVVSHITSLTAGDIDMRVYVADSARNVLEPGVQVNALAVAMVIENGVATLEAFSYINNVRTDYPTSSVVFSRDVAAGTATLSFDSALVPFATPVYVSTSSYHANAYSVAYVDSGDENFGFGPIAQGPFDTTTVVSFSAPTQQRGGVPVTIFATVSVDTTGYVLFTENGAAIGTAPIVGRTAALALPAIVPTGVHAVQATFVPAAGVKYLASTSAAASFTVLSNAAATTTKIALSKKTQKYKKTASKLTITVSAKATGKVAIFDGKKKIKTVKVSAGKKVKYTLAKKLKKGKHSLKAVFTPTDAEAFVASTSKTVKLTVKR